MADSNELSEECAWLNEAIRSGVVNRFDHKCFHRFISFLDSEKSSLNSVPQTSLRTLVRQRSINDDVISWIMRVINDDIESSCVILSYHQSICGGLICEDVLDYL